MSCYLLKILRFLRDLQKQKEFNKQNRKRDKICPRLRIAKTIKIYQQIGKFLLLLEKP